MTRISTVIPVYNGETYLREALESVVSQGYANHEVIVVDDGSTDSSRSVASSYPGVLVITQTHRGVAAARNSGIEAASGALLAFLDADDQWEPGKLTSQVEYLSKNTQFDGVFGYLRNYVQAGITRPEWVRDRHLDRDLPGHSLCTLLVKRDVFDRVGVFNPALESGEDGDWFFRAKDSGIRFAMMEQRLLLRRIHNLNLSHDAEAVRAGILRAVRSSVERRQSREGTDA